MPAAMPGTHLTFLESRVAFCARALMLIKSKQTYIFSAGPLGEKNLASRSPWEFAGGGQAELWPGGGAVMSSSAKRSMSTLL